MQFSAITDQISFIGRKKRQRDVFWDLAQNQTRFLYNVAFRYVGNRYDAEDLVQETLYTAYNKFHQLRDSRKLKSWMFTILRNHFLKWQRKKAPVQTDTFEDGIDYLSQLESVSLRNDVASAYESKVEAETVQSILSKLPEKNHIEICKTCEKLYHSDRALDTILKKGLQAVEPPPGLIMRARHKIESESRPRSFRLPSVSWKTVVPALSMAALVMVILLNPFSGHLQTVEEVVAYSIANHLDTSMKMDFQAGDVSDVGQWFSQRLGYNVRMPDLKNLGLNLRGGRKCTLGKVEAAFLLCQSKGKLASLFLINQNDVAVPFDRKRKYIVEEGDIKVTLWEESGVVYAMVI